MLSIQKITKYYDGQLLLDQISFDLERCETICLLGSSGSGKSTLLKMIAGLEVPDDGQILWNQQNLDTIPVHQRNFGLMFQEYALFPHRTVAENVAFGLEMKKLPKAEIKSIVKDALSMVDMGEFADRHVTELSGGEKQRVALARALAPRPHLLMLDEPLGALDRGLRDQLILDLRKILKRTGIPAIYVTHDQEEAYTIADRMLLLHHGKIVQDGKPEEVYNHPANIWVAAFLGSTNRFPGTVLSISPLVIQSVLGEVQINEDKPERYKIQQRVTLILKPSGLGLIPADKAGKEATVMDCVFSGELFRLILQVENISLKIVSREAFIPGTKISFYLYPDAMICLPEEEA
jgi:ABC-type Fe3+/spermidine/putrescine transport system ATPase subunit